MIAKVVGYDGKSAYNVSKPDDTSRKLVDISRLRPRPTPLAKATAAKVGKCIRARPSLPFSPMAKAQCVFCYLGTRRSAMFHACFGQPRGAAADALPRSAIYPV
jgi:hypothetical protein